MSSLFNRNMTAYVDHLTNTKWSAATTLMTTGTGRFYVNLSSSVFKKKTFETAIKSSGLDVIKGSVQTTKGQSVLFLDNNGTRVLRDVVEAEQFMLKFKSDSEMLAAAGLLDMQNTTAIVLPSDNDIGKLVFGMMVVTIDKVHNSTSMGTHNAYVFEEDVAQAFEYTTAQVRKALKSKKHSYFRRPANVVHQSAGDRTHKDYSRAYALSDIMVEITANRHLRASVGPKIANFIDSVCDTVEDKARRSDVVLVKCATDNVTTEAYCKVADLELTAAISHPQMCDDTKESERGRIAMATASMNAKFDADRSDLLAMSKVEICDDDILDLSSSTESESENTGEIVVFNKDVVDAKNFARSDYHQILYAQAASCLANYPNKEGGAAHFIMHSAGCELPANFDEATADMWRVFWCGETSKPEARFKQHRRDANNSGHCYLNEFSEFQMIPLHHAALKHSSVKELEKSFHKALKAVDGVWMSDKNGFVLDSTLTDSSNTARNMKELFLVRFDAQEKFYKVVTDFRKTCGSQSGVLDLLRDPEETYNTTIGRVCIDRFQGAMEAVVERTVTGILGVVSNLSENTNRAIGLVGTMYADANSRIDKVTLQARADVAAADARADSRVEKATAAAAALTATADARAEKAAAAARADAEKAAAAARADAEKAAAAARADAENARAEARAAIERENEFKNKMLAHFMNLSAAK